MPIVANQQPTKKSANIVFTNQPMNNILQTRYSITNVDENTYKDWISNCGTLQYDLDGTQYDYEHLFGLFDGYISGTNDMTTDAILVGIMNELSFSRESGGLNKWLLNQWAAKFNMPLPSANVLYTGDDLTQAILDYKNNPSYEAMANVLWTMNCCTNSNQVPYASFLVIDDVNVHDAIVNCINAAPNKSAESDGFLSYFSGISTKISHFDLVSALDKNVIADVLAGAQALNKDANFFTLNIVDAFIGQSNVYMMSLPEILSHSHSVGTLLDKYSETYLDDVVSDSELKLVRQVDPEELAKANVRALNASSGIDFKAKSLTLSGLVYDTSDAKSYYAAVYRKLVRLILSGKLSKRSCTRLPVVKKSWNYDNRRGLMDVKGKHKAKTTVTNLRVYLDTSGSVSEEDYYDGLCMLFDFCRRYKIQFELRCFSTKLGDIRRVSYTSKNRFKQILTELSPGGGTDFDIVYRDAALARDSICVLFSDMEDYPSYSSPDLPQNLFFLPYHTCVNTAVDCMEEIFNHYISQQTITADYIKTNVLGVHALVSSVDN